MDKRRTQRILGILVIIALVIILFPLLFSKNEVTTQTASVATPAFPEQDNASTAAATIAQPLPANNSADTVTEAKQDAATVPMTDAMAANTDAEQAPAVDAAPNAGTDAAPMANATPMNPAADPEANATAVPSANTAQDTKQPLELNDVSTAEPAQAAKPMDQAAAQPAVAAVPVVEEENTTQATQQVVETPKPIKSSKAKTHHHVKPAHHDVAKLNKPAWVVQMGSFKSKENARSLTDKLRAAGFNAFTKEIKSAKGTVRTRVYVGPEFKEAAATKTSKKIQHDMNLQCVVMPYKPLAL